MSVLEVEISSGHVRAIPASVGAFGQTVLAGPGELLGWSFRESGAETGLAVESSVVAPGAGVAVATLSNVPVGVYNVTWTVQLIGAAAAADQDNFVLKVGATSIAVSLNAGAAGQYPQTPLQINVTALSNVTVNAVGAGTAGVTYAVQLALTPATTGQAALEIRDGNQILGEVTSGTAGSLTQWFGPEGIRFLNQLTVLPVTGQMVGVVYARFGRALGYT